MKANRNVSTSSLSREQKAVVAELKIKPKQATGSRTATSLCWQYVGPLYSNKTSEDQDQLIDDTRLYCFPCLESIQNGSKQMLQMHISNLTSFGLSTSSGNIKQHLSLKHGINTCKENSVQTMAKYLTKYSASLPSTAATAHEFNRDILIWFCRDLLPFEEVEKAGFTAFFTKIFPSLPAPTGATLSITALNDVYHSCVARVKDYLEDVPAVCIMFDGWTDKYRARPYVGVRVCFIKNREYRIITLSCEVLVGHTGQQLADHVSRVMSSFFPDPKKMIRSSCHDGAANMLKASKIMRVDYYQHCVAHGLHLLLTVDSLNDVHEVQELLLKCREIVSTLHFKSYLVQDELAATADRAEVEKLIVRMSAVSAIQELDDTFPVADEATDIDPPQENLRRDHQHTTLKLSCPTR